MQAEKHSFGWKTTTVEVFGRHNWYHENRS